MSKGQVMMKSYRDLQVWQKAYDPSTKHWPMYPDPCFSLDRTPYLYYTFSHIGPGVGL